MTEALPLFFDKPSLQILLFGGKGGVGKTTCATSAALKLALRAPERQFLLVSTDPAHSLRDCLADSACPRNLRVIELDAAAYLDSFRARNGAILREIAASGTFLDDEDIDRFLNLSLPGLDELMAFLEITSWAETGEYGCIVVDTAPSGHTLNLLSMGKMIRKWLLVLETLLAKRRYMRKIFSHKSLPDELDTFVHVSKTSLSRMERLLHNPARCQFVPVTIAEPLSVQETVAVCAELRKRGISVQEILVNQLHYFRECPSCTAAHFSELTQIKQLVAGLEAPCNLWGIPEFADEVRGLGQLCSFWDYEWRIEPSSLQLKLECAIPVRPISQPADALPDSMRFVLFAGKGGVGKTTFACASAIRFALDSPGRRVLLFSTDPAHSLSACLEVAVGPKPNELLPGLWAMEINAEAEFNRLKVRYADDVSRFLESVCRRFDLVFDRVVLERMLDLAPPGLDEVMALTRIMEFLQHGSYDLFVLDCAATGHLIRLLELPELIDDWLKAFFSFFLKYEGILRLPGFADELVAISRNLKRLRAVLKNPDEAALNVVSIPTQMALEETKDLLAACRRMEVAVPALFLNMLTPPSDCPLCSALVQREQGVLACYTRDMPGLRQTRIYRQALIGGLTRLQSFGNQLYLPCAVGSACHAL